MPESLDRGESVGMQLRLQDVEVPKPLATIEWNGYSSAALYHRAGAGQLARRPASPGHAHRSAATEQPFGKIEFAIPVAAPRTGG